MSTTWLVHPDAPRGQTFKPIGVGTTGASALRAIVADDDAFVRERIRGALSEAPDIELIATARGGAEALRIALELRPDVLVLDDNMPIVGGLAGLARLQSEAPEIRVVMYVESPGNCIDAAAMGAASCVIKGWPLDALVWAIRRTHVGT